MTSEQELGELLPLPGPVFHILLALVQGERHGYAILQDVEERSNNEVRLSAGTLYRNLEQMASRGLIAEVAKRPTRLSDDARRRYYRATPLGMAAARAEVARLAGLVRLAKSRGLTPSPAL